MPWYAQNLTCLSYSQNENISWMTQRWHTASNKHFLRCSLSCKLQRFPHGVEGLGRAVRKRVQWYLPRVFTEFWRHRLSYGFFKFRTWIDKRNSGREPIRTSVTCDAPIPKKINSKEYFYIQQWKGRKYLQQKRDASNMP